MEAEKGEKIIIITKKDLMKNLNKLYKVNHMMIKIIVAGFQELCLNNPSDKVTFQDVEEKLNEVKKHIESSIETNLPENSILIGKKWRFENSHLVIFLILKYLILDYLIQTFGIIIKVSIKLYIYNIF